MQKSLAPASGDRWPKAGTTPVRGVTLDIGFGVAFAPAGADGLVRVLEIILKPEPPKKP